MVWRVVPTGSGKLIGESRDLQKKLARFFCVNLRTGEVLWEGKGFGEPWWIGIEAVREDTVLLHRFAHPDLPEHRGVIAVDVRTGSELWRNDEMTFAGVSDEGIIVRRRRPVQEDALLLHFRTGEVLGRGPTGRPAEIEQDALLPVPLYEDDDDEQAVHLLRELCTAGAIVWPVDMIEREGAVIYNYHTKRPDYTDEVPRLKSILTIVDRQTGSVLFSDMLCGDARVVVPDAFLVSGGMLVYVHERTTLTAVDVSDL